MPVTSGQQPVFRFAPSPNGRLHLGHALSALLNHAMARQAQGLFLVRMEDIDAARCTPSLADGVMEDLAWLGLIPDRPVRYQSRHLDDYRQALDRLQQMGLVYPAFLSRGEVKSIVSAAQARGETWPRDPDGAPLYPNVDRLRSPAERAALLASGAPHAWRLDMRKALAQLKVQSSWTETGRGSRERVTGDPSQWGDVVLSRSDAPSSYTLSVVVDDAAQGVTHVVRGLDLFHATAVQRLLQDLLGLPEPIYHHHRLILGPDGRKLSKSDGSTALAELRASGVTPSEIRRMLQLEG